MLSMQSEEIAVEHAVAEDAEEAEALNKTLNKVNQNPNPMVKDRPSGQLLAMLMDPHLQPVLTTTLMDDLPFIALIH